MPAVALLLLCHVLCMLLWCDLRIHVNTDPPLTADTDARSPFLDGFDLTQGLPEWPWDDPVGGVRECEEDYGSLRTSDLTVSASALLWCIIMCLMEIGVCRWGAT